MASAAVDAMLASRRGFVVAAAGCGKTHLLGQLVADQRSGRQLVLTHTHAGVAAIKKRLSQLRVPHDKFHLDTIAGWCLRYGASYPEISGFQPDAEANPDWEATYPGAEKVCRTALGKRVLKASYDGVVVDEYQDCTQKQHALISAIAECIPCRGVGDPLQTIFGFRANDPVVAWSTIKKDFDVVDDALVIPWRWRRSGHSAQLGDWLIAARTELETTGRLTIKLGAPVTWVQQSQINSAAEAWASACRDVSAPANESLVAILKWPSACIDLAKRMGGRWPIVESFDDPDLLRLGFALVDAGGPTTMALLVEFVAARMTGMGTSLKTAIDSINAGRGVSRITKHREHADRLNAIASTPTPVTALAWLEGVLADREAGWWLYRRECVMQMREALRDCENSTLTNMPDLVAAARTRARHRGRHTAGRTIGTTLLVKGLEFDHSVIMWEPNRFSKQGLYVALTRASKSLTIVSSSRTLVPEGQ